MKLKNRKFRNKKSGDIMTHNEDWEVYKDPKDFWFIDDEGDVEVEEEEYEDSLDSMKSIGNYFKTEEEAKKAVEKLKAWKRLKDKGFRFESYKPYGTGITFTIAHMKELAEDNKKDLELLFGGEDGD